MNSTATQTPKATPLPQDLGQQIEALREELVKLAASVTDDMSDGLGKAARQVGRASRDARDTASQAAQRHPLAAIGIAAGLVLMVGLLVRKS